MLEEAAPLTEPPRGGWLGEWLLSVWGYFEDALGTFLGARGDCSRGDRACGTVLVMTVLVARPGTGC